MTLVIARSPTRQSLRRSGCGSPAKADGDGASEATKNLAFIEPEQILRFAQDDNSL